MFLEQYELNVLLIAIIALIMTIVSMFLLFKSIFNFTKEPEPGSEVPKGTPNLYYEEPELDVPTFKRKNLDLSFDNFKPAAQS